MPASQIKLEKETHPGLLSRRSTEPDLTNILFIPTVIDRRGELVAQP